MLGLLCLQSAAQPVTGQSQSGAALECESVHAAEARKHVACGERTCLMRSPCSTTAPSASSGPASMVAWYGCCVSHTTSTASSAAARRVTGRVRTRRSAYLHGSDTGGRVSARAWQRLQNCTGLTVERQIPARLGRLCALPRAACPRGALAVGCCAPHLPPRTSTMPPLGARESASPIVAQSPPAPTTRSGLLACTLRRRSRAATTSTAASCNNCRLSDC